MDALGVADAHVTYSVLEYGIAVLAIILLMLLIRSFSLKNLPPGPTGLPIIGSLHLLGDRPHDALAKMAQKYKTRLLSLYMGQKLYVVATSAETAMEFLKSQDSIFSSRPRLRAFQVILPKDVTFSDITPESRHLRKILHVQLTSARSIEESEHIRRDEITQMVQSIPSNAVVNVKSCLEVMTANVLTRLTIGKRFMRADMDAAEERELHEFIEISEEIGMCFGTANPADVIPAMKWVDVLGLEKRFRRVRSKMEVFLRKIVDERRAEKASEKDLLDVLLAEMDTNEDVTSEVVTSIIWEVFAAGMETTVLATEWTMAEILHNPKVQAAAHAELDSVVGRSRLVAETDLPHLKYIKTVVKESLRLHPVLPLLIPHESHSPCRASGYDIPANTSLLVNVWAIGRDPQVWENPLEFRPERFLEREMEFSAKDQFELLPFGAGRRMCMGLSLGALLVELSVASLLQGFVWEQAGELNMAEGLGLSVRMAVPLSAVAAPRLAPDVYHTP